MSFIDRMAAKIMPPESEEDRVNARRVAESATSQGDWLHVILDHHRQIETAFKQAIAASSPQERNSAVKRLGVLLTAHANAEESVIYPALANIGEKADAGMAYEEQAMAKIQMAKLEHLDPMSREWTDKLEHIHGAVLHHVYEEEGTWFPKLQQNLGVGERSHIGRRYLEEFERYAGKDAGYKAPMQMAAQEPRPEGNQPGNWGAADF